MFAELPVRHHAAARQCCICEEQSLQMPQLFVELPQLLVELSQLPAALPELLAVM